MKYLIIRIIVVLGGIYGLIYYKLTNKIILSTSPIEYNIIKAVRDAGGRVIHYDLYVLYKNKKYSLSISQNMYEDITTHNISPNLYYNKYFDSVVAYDNPIMGERLSIACIIAFIITFIPFPKINAFFDKKAKETHAKEAKKVRSILQMRQQNLKKEHDINTVVKNKFTADNAVKSKKAVRILKSLLGNAVAKRQQRRKN